jgi:hypothetical protein
MVPGCSSASSQNDCHKVINLLPGQLKAKASSQLPDSQPTSFIFPIPNAMKLKKPLSSVFPYSSKSCYLLTDQSMLCSIIEG